MINQSRRLWSLVISFTLLAAVPAYGEAAVVQPFPTASSQTGDTSSGEVTGPGAAMSGQKPEASVNSQTQSGAESGNVAQPVIHSEGAILLDASTGAVLYGKNAETRYYPASITKLMTALLVAEKTNPSDTVVFSKSATTNLESGAVTLGLVEGDRLTVEQSLYGLMLKSANEVANGLAEHVSGSVGGFAALMNARARELGCTNTNFVNPNGLNNSGHYTTPHDMALIARAAFNNEKVRKVVSTSTYQIPATKNAGKRTVTMGHKMIQASDSRYYPGVIGGKTGYTSLAGNTLVTCAEKNGVRLIAVIMKSKSTHYADTRALFDYGFALKAEGTSITPASSGWIKNGTRWNYKKQNGTNASQEWLTVDGVDYYIDSDGTMVNGWREFPGNVWYYFRSSGAKAQNYWVETNNKWYYLGSNGVMVRNTVTPDGYPVNSDGVWTP